MKKLIPIIIFLIIISVFSITNRTNEEVISISDEEYLIIEDKVFLENRPVFFRRKQYLHFLGNY